MTITYRVPGIVPTERAHSVPLDHSKPDGKKITVFTRELAAPDGLDRPYLLFLQGGPGIEATRPTAPPSGWQKRAIADYRVLLLDQRGTGRSTPVGDIPGSTPQEQAAYMTHLRADGIVRDAELIRKELGVDRWSILGQSFGGFCSMTYLSFAPEGLREAFITGGLSPIGRPIDDVYAATWLRAIQKNRAYFQRYPGDRERVGDILRRLDDEDVRLPSGDRLTSRRFLQLGFKLGDSAGFEQIHHILELPLGSRAFLHDMEEAVRFGRTRSTPRSTNRLTPTGCPRAGRLSGRCPKRSSRSVTSRLSTCSVGCGTTSPGCTLIAPPPRSWRSTPGRACTTLTQLARNEVPVAATIYVNDLYVERRFAEETAVAIRGLRPWITDEYEHNGLRTTGSASSAGSLTWCAVGPDIELRSRS